MKKFLYRIAFPAIVLALVYHFGYSSGRRSGIQSSAVMPEITSAPQSSVPASIASPTLTPTVVETSEKLPTKDSPNRVKSGTGKAPTVKRIRQTPEGLAIEDQLVQSLPSVKGSEKVVFRAPNISGNQSELQPLKIEPAPGSPLIAKPSTAPKDSDCGCGNKK